MLYTATLGVSPNAVKPILQHLNTETLNVATSQYHNHQYCNASMLKLPIYQPTKTETPKYIDHHLLPEIKGSFSVRTRGGKQVFHQGLLGLVSVSLGSHKWWLCLIVCWQVGKTQCHHALTSSTVVFFLKESARAVIL